MATFVNRNGRVRAVVRIKGETITKTFDSKQEAKVWATGEENRLNHRITDAGGMTLGAILLKYVADVLEMKNYKVGTWHAKRLARLFSHVELKDMDKDWWMAAAQSFGDVSPSSRLRYLICIKSALVTARDLWKVTYDWAPFHEAMGIMVRQGIIGQGRPRTRRVSPDEVQAIKVAANAFNHSIPMRDIIDFALATCMRRAEITGLKWEDLDDNKRAPMVWVRNRKDPRKKDGNDDHVPLLGKALEIIKRQPRTPGEPRIFPYSASVVSIYFCQYARHAKVKGVRFHDLRHEGISRLFELGFNIPEVALVSGHKNWKTLQKYTHIKPVSLHSGPIAVRAARRAA